MLIPDILPLFYLPPVSYFKVIKQHGQVTLDLHEHYVKQTYRNHCNIYGANGILKLTVPVIKGSNVHTKMQDVRIANDVAWKRIHWLSLESAYRKTAYFEYYEDDFNAVYQRDYTYLADLNKALMQVILAKLKMDVQPGYTEEYCRDVYNDFDNREEYKPYYQPFSSKYGFIPNLSIVDLLFNQGPRANDYL